MKSGAATTVLLIVGVIAVMIAVAFYVITRDELDQQNLLSSSYQDTIGNFVPLVDSEDYQVYEIKKGNVTKVAASNESTPQTVTISFKNGSKTEQTDFSGEETEPFIYLRYCVGIPDCPLFNNIVHESDFQKQTWILERDEFNEQNRDNRVVRIISPDEILAGDQIQIISTYTGQSGELVYSGREVFITRTKAEK